MKLEPNLGRFQKREILHRVVGLIKERAHIEQIYMHNPHDISIVHKASDLIDKQAQLEDLLTPCCCRLNAAF